MKMIEHFSVLAQIHFSQVQVLEMNHHEMLQNVAVAAGVEEEEEAVVEETAVVAVNDESSEDDRKPPAKRSRTE